MQRTLPEGAGLDPAFTKNKTSLLLTVPGIFVAGSFYASESLYQEKITSIYVLDL